MVLCIFFYSESISMKAPSLLCSYKHFIQNAKPWGIQILFAQLGCIDCTMLECGNIALHLEFSLWNSARQTWTEHTLHFMGWSQLELKCTLQDCKNVKHQVWVSLLICILKNCYSDFFFLFFSAVWRLWCHWLVFWVIKLMHFASWK